MNKFTHEEMVAKIAETFSKRGFRVTTERDVGAMTRADIVAAKGDKKFVIEVKAGPPSHYLPYSAYTQARRIHSAMPDALPMVCTSMAVSDDLKALFAKANIPVVPADPTLQEGEFFRNINQEMAELNMKVPDELKE